MMVTGQVIGVREVGIGMGCSNSDIYMLATVLVVVAHTMYTLP